MGVGVNGVYVLYEGWIVALDLVARSGAQFEDFASSGADKGGNTGGVFKGDKAACCARELVCSWLGREQEIYKLWSRVLLQRRL